MERCRPGHGEQSQASQANHWTDPPQSGVLHRKGGKSKTCLVVRCEKERSERVVVRSASPDVFAVHAGPNCRGQERILLRLNDAFDYIFPLRTLPPARGAGDKIW